MREIVENVENIMDRMGYDYCGYFGCFDVAAKRGKKVVLIKVLGNIDSVQEEQANNIKTIARNLDATSIIVGERTRREKLAEGVVYTRFGIPTIDIRTMENVFSNKAMPFVSRGRGGLFVEIDSKLLRKRRQDTGLTQMELARRTGTTKKNIYEHERANKKTSRELAEKLQDAVGHVSVPAALYTEKETAETRPKGYFEGVVFRRFKSIGFETDLVHQAPFNIIARQQRVLILSEAEESVEKIGRMLEEMINFSKLFNKPIIAVTKEEVELGIPTILESELRTYSSSDIKRIVRNW